MVHLKIHRVNKTRYQVKNGKNVVRECSTHQEAMDAIIYGDLLLLDNLNDFCDTELDDLELVEDFREAA